jgi:CBS domain-containing protein
MTTQVISVSPDLPIESVAVILDQHRIRRVPVLRDGQLAGIVSRGDLVKALANEPARAPVEHSDTQLISAMKARLAGERWAPVGLVIQARGGVLSLWGLAETEAEKSAVETMARAVEGVKDVENRITVRSHLPYWYGGI